MKRISLRYSIVISSGWLRPYKCFWRPGSDVRLDFLFCSKALKFLLLVALYQHVSSKSSSSYRDLPSKRYLYATMAALFKPNLSSTVHTVQSVRGDFARAK